MKHLEEVRNLRKGGYIIVDDEPCKILSITTSKPGKHGEAKARMDVNGIFDNRKRSIVNPVTHKVQVPNIDKRKAQVLSVQPTSVQLMDMESFETFDMAIPDDPEKAEKIVEGAELSYLEAMGRRMFF